MSFEDDLKFANDVLRIRKEMFDETIFYGLPITSNFDSNFQFKSFSLRGKSERGSRIFGNTNTLQHIGTIDNQTAPTIITSKSIVFNDNGLEPFMTIDMEQRFHYEVYTEELYFQHSLVYSDLQLRYMVVASVLKQNPLRNCTRFKIFWYYVPILAKLLRYKDNGIL